MKHRALRVAAACSFWLFAIGGCPPEPVSDGDAGDAAEAGTTTEAGTCDPACHFDCGGGLPRCSGGTLTYSGFGARPCCGPGSGTSTPGLSACEVGTASCASGGCATVDARYRGHLNVPGNFSAPFAGDGPNAMADAPRLLCTVSVAVAPGSPCSSDGDCRPAPSYAAALRCDTASASPTCVATDRPEPTAEYGGSCGFTSGQLQESPIGESITLSADCGDTWMPCQVYNDGEGCTAQRCTVACFFDEDCPAGSVCLSASYAIDALPGYCAPATNRTTEEGRFGATGCP